jgi:hypothetical protein
MRLNANRIALPSFLSCTTVCCSSVQLSPSAVSGVIRRVLCPASRAIAFVLVFVYAVSVLCVCVVCSCFCVFVCLFVRLCVSVLVVFALVCLWSSVFVCSCAQCWLLI